MTIPSKTLEEIIYLSKKEKKTADILMEEGKVMGTLNSLGEVYESGSYLLDLMLNSFDIDLFVVNPSISKQENAILAINEFIKGNYFNGYHYFDWVQFRKEYFPKGYYVGVQRPFKEQKWKIDIWFYEKYPRKHMEYLERLKKLTEEQRNLILQIKNERANGIAMGGANTYNLVLENKVKTIEEYLAMFDK